MKNRLLFVFGMFVISTGVVAQVKKPPTNLELLQSRGLDPRISNIRSAALQEVLPKSLPPDRDIPTSIVPRYYRLKTQQVVAAPNIRIHPNSTTTQSEMSIHTHPTNPDIVLAGSNAVDNAVSVLSQGWYYTTNGGTTWSGSDTLPTHTNLGTFLADPAVGIDLDNTLFFSALNLGSPNPDVFVSNSTNNGTTWNRTFVSNPGSNEDKGHFTNDVNPGSPYENYLYTAFTDFGPNPSPIIVSRSTDHGQNFSTPISISGGIGSYFAQGINLGVGPGSEVYAVWSGYDNFPTTSTKVGFNVSTNGGASWGTAKSIDTINEIRGSLIKGGNSIRVSSFPSMAIDRSNGPRRGWIYVVYPENNGATPDIMLLRSTNGGNSWRPAVKVNQDNSGKDQWYPWVTVDPTTGGLYIVYYDSRNFPANDSAQVYISNSLDGGDTFEDVLVSDMPFLPAPIPGLASGYMGDYIGIAAVNGVVWPCWNDNRTGRHQAYTSRMVFLSVGSGATISASPDTLDFGTMFIGHSDTVTLNIRNLGYPDSLFISDIHSDSSTFTPSLTSLAIPGGNSRSIRVAFSPTATGIHTGNLSITSNDTAHPVLLVPMHGNVVYPPVVGATPDSMYFSVNEGDSAGSTLTIGNTGLGDLQFTLSKSYQSSAATQEASKLRDANSTLNESPYRWGEEPPRNQHEIPSPWAAEKRRAITSLLPIIVTDSIGDGGTVDIKEIRGELTGGNLTLQLVFEIGFNPSNFGGYLGLDADQNQLTGISLPYGKASQDVGCEYYISFFTLGSGMVNLYNSSNLFLGSFAATTESNSFTFTIPLTNLGNDDGRMNLAAIIGNSSGPTDWIPDAGHGVTGADWLAFTPVTGIVGPAGNLGVQVKVHTEFLDGGSFHATLNLRSNDPLTPLLSLPVELRVYGAPNLVLDRDTVNFENAFVNYPDTIALMVSNNGSDTLHVTGMTNTNARFSIIGPTVFNLAPSRNQPVLLRFLPLSVGNQTGNLSITSNDPSDPTVTAFLFGNGLLPPEISIAPDSLTENLFTGDTSSQIITVSNGGLSDLNFSLSLRYLPSSATASQSSQLAFGQRADLSHFAREISGEELARTSSRPDASALAGKASMSTAAADILLLTTTSVTVSVGRALDSLGKAFDLISTSNFTGIDFSPYKTLIVTMDGGAIEEASVQALANAAASGKMLVMIGGTGYSPYYTGIQNYLLSHNGTTGWANSITPHLLVTDASHRLAFGLPTTYNFVSGNAYYMLRINDLNAPVAAKNGDGYPILVNKSIGGGALVYFTGSPYESYWTNPADFAILRQILSNALSFRAWLSAAPQSGIVPAGLSLGLNVGFDANGLKGGDYRADLVFTSNDPATPTVSTPVHLHVTGAPNIVISKDTISYGDAYVGFQGIDSIKITNTGTDVLTLSDISSDNPHFVPDAVSSSISPGAFRTVRVALTPTDTGIVTGKLTIKNNDPRDSIRMVELAGHGIYPPVIAVTPDSLGFTVNEGDSAIAQIIIANHGLGELRWGGTVTAFRGSSAMPYTLPARAVSASASNVDAGVSVSSLQQQEARTNDGIRELSSVTANLEDLTNKRIGITNSSIYSQIISDLVLRGAIVSNISFPLSTGVLDSLNVLSVDDYIGGATTSDISMMRNWVQAGGAIIVQGDDGSSILNINELLSGSGISETSLGGYSDAVFTNILPHPTTTGVNSINASAYGAYSTAVSPAQTIVFDNFSRPNIVVSTLGAGRILVSGNEVMIDGNVGTGDTRLFSNQVIDWLSAAANFVVLNPSSGTVVPGDSQSVEVKIKTDQLEGGTFHAYIHFDNNDPGHQDLVVPVQLRVIGKPRIVVTPDSIEFGNGYVGFSKPESLTVTNIGSDTLIVAGISSNNTAFTALPSSFTVSPHNSRKVVVTFSPADTGGFLGTLTIPSNDSSRLTLNVKAHGRGIYPPVIAVTPDSLGFTVNEGDSAVATLTLNNSGLGALNFTIKNETIFGGGANQPASSTNGKTSITFAGDAINPRNTIMDASIVTSILKNNSLAAMSSGDSPIAPNLGAIAGEHKGKMTLDEMLRSRERFGAVSSTLKVVVLDSYGTDYVGSTWDSLNANWGRFGSTEIVVDYTSLNKEGITYTDIVNTGANILVISDAFYSNWDFTTAEWSAIRQYTEEGHGLVVTSGSINNSSAPNNTRNLTALFGLDTLSQYLWAVSASSLHFVVPGHPLLKNITSPYTPSSLNTAVPYPSYNWKRVAHGAEVIAISADSTTSLLTNQNRVYISNIPEASPNQNDYQLLYNAFVWSSSGTSWLSENPTSGTVAAGGSLPIQVKVKSDQLEGGTFHAKIHFDNNDPGHQDLVVPVQLRVVGQHLVELISPLDGTGNQPCAEVVHLRYAASRGAVRYHVQVAWDSQFSTMLFDDSLVTQKQIDIPLPASDSTFYWRVKAKFIDEIWSAWTPTWRFRQAIWKVQASGTTSDLRGVWFTNINAGTIVGFGGTILQTTDAGITWTSRSSGTTNALYAVAFGDANNGTAVGARGTILHTTDGGATWASQSSGTTRILTSVCFTDTLNGTVVGWYGTILRTTNGGTTWTNQTSGLLYNLSGVSFSDANTGNVVGEWQTILRTSDGGTNWVSQSNGAPLAYSAVFLTDDNRGTIVGEGGTILKTTDGGSTWTSESSGTSKGLNAVRFIDSVSGTTVGDGGTILETTNGGALWEDHGCGITNTLFGVSLLAPNMATVIGPGGVILRTTPGGVVSVEERPMAELPHQFELSKNYPNPFNPTTTIRFAIPVSGFVTLKVYNLLGQEVANLVDGVLEPGYKSVSWDAGKLASGIYFYRLSAGTFTSVKKMMLVK